MFSLSGAKRPENNKPNSPHFLVSFVNEWTGGSGSAHFSGFGKKITLGYHNVWQEI